MKSILCILVLLVAMVGSAGASMTETFSWDAGDFVLQEKRTAEFKFDLTSAGDNYARLLNDQKSEVANSYTSPSVDVSSYDPNSQSITAAQLDFSFYDTDHQADEEVTITASIADGGSTLWSEQFSLGTQGNNNTTGETLPVSIDLVKILSYLQDGQLLTLAIAPDLNQLNDVSIKEASLTVSAVPLPAALPLVVSGLLGLGLYRRKVNQA